MNIEIEARAALEAAQRASEFMLSPAQRTEALQPIVTALIAMSRAEAEIIIRKTFAGAGTASSLVVHMYKQQRPAFYLGTPPTACDICARFITTEFIDGATVYGRWANMCPTCFKFNGLGLGTGRGQKYTRETVADKFTKSEG